MRVFVYGTLRKGQPNHELLAGAEYLGSGRTWDGYTMIHLGGFPGVVRSGGDTIKGELYDVDDATLARLDLLEGHPTFYRRRRTDVINEDGDDMVAEMYLLPEDWLDMDYRVIHGGDWKDR